MTGRSTSAGPCSCAPATVLAALACCSILKSEWSLQESEIGSNLAHVALQAVTLSALPEEAKAEAEAGAGPAA